MAKGSNKELARKNREHLAKKQATREAHQATTPAKSKETAKKEPLASLKAKVKATWSKVKHLTDAKRDELAALLERGDAELFTQYQKTWATRCKTRHEAWLRGTSKSAEAMRTKRTARPAKTSKGQG